MTSLSIQRTSDGVLTSADSATIAVFSSTGFATVPVTTVAPTSAGVYTYSTGYLSPDVYTVEWVFAVSGQPNETITRTFRADGPAEVSNGVTLMQIEERLARRVGPYRKYAAAASSTVENLVISRLISSLEIGDFEDLEILRRGIILATGAQIENFPEDDRQRVISSYVAATGTITPDSSWTLAPQLGERIEFHYLDPEQELRVAALEGLERCYFWDRGLVTVDGTLRELDLSASFPWLRDTSGIANVELAIPSSLVPSSPLSWYRGLSTQGVQSLQTQWLGPGSLYIDYLRPHSTFVNGEASLTGPNDDFDVLLVDLEYAVRAGHCTAWQNFPDRLTPVAAQGLRLTATQAASAFTQRSRNILEQMPERFVGPRWETDEVLSQVGNAPG